MAGTPPEHPWFRSCFSAAKFPFIRFDCWTGAVSYFDAERRDIMNDRAAIPPPGFLADLTRFLFFIGKGGVAKTLIACAAALALANTGKSVLLVSTDPASNLDEILDVPLGNLPVAVPGAERAAKVGANSTIRR
jgi:hypothetical protein